MHRIYYAEKDTTLYERHPERNAGVDQIIELIKVASGSRAFENGIDLGIQASSYNTRMIIDFGSEITSLSQSIAKGEIPQINNVLASAPLSASVYLNLHATDASDLTSKYEIYAYPISESWESGTGTFSDSPEARIGASWLYRKGDAKAASAIAWDTGSANSIVDGPGVSELQGGGTYFLSADNGFGPEGHAELTSQIFNNQSPDVRMDVTSIVKGWIDGDRPNYGFMVKRDRADEISGEVLGSLKFFGRESHTIFVPRLEVCWDDSNYAYQTSISSNTYVPYIKNIKNEYRTSEIARFRIGVRPEFPTKSYATSSFYMTTDNLPVSSSYEILDSVTNDIIIKDETTYRASTTKISNDLDGSYFNLRMDSFMPERYYKIKLTCRRTNDTQTFDDFYFKVVR
tara:strand:- start:333 stop:1535 length:1203 start_codon:yes stop_codon:yes gene_type:complete